MGELKWQVRRRGVMSVYGYRKSKSGVVKRLYRSIMLQREEFDGLRFKRCRWVPVYAVARCPLDLTDLSRRLYIDLEDEFYDGNLEELLSSGTLNRFTSKAIGRALRRMQHEELVESCREFLREEDSLVVLDGLRSKDDWDSIKMTLLLEPPKGCVVVITTDYKVALHCVDNKKERVVDADRLDHVRDLQAKMDKVIYIYISLQPSQYIQYSLHD
jgi:hypothetical protein